MGRAKASYCPDRYLATVLRWSIVGLGWRGLVASGLTWLSHRVDYSCDVQLEFMGLELASSSTRGERVSVSIK